MRMGRIGVAIIDIDNFASSTAPTATCRSDEVLLRVASSSR